MNNFILSKIRTLRNKKLLLVCLCHECFNFIRGAHYVLRQALASVFRDQKVIFNTDSDLPFINVQTWLIGNDSTWAKLAVGGNAYIMNINSKMVRNTVHVIFSNLLFLLNQTHTNAALGKNLLTHII